MIREHTHRWVAVVEEDEGHPKKHEGPVVLLGDFSRSICGILALATPVSIAFSTGLITADSPPEEEGYKNITSLTRLTHHTPSFTFLDSHVHLRTRQSSSIPSGSSPPRQSGPYGPLHTFTGFTAPGRTSTSRIDFVMLVAEASPTMASHGESEAEKRTAARRGRGGWEVTQYACVDNWIEEGDVSGWQGRWSDHRAVKVTIRREA